MVTGTLDLIVNKCYSAGYRVPYGMDENFSGLSEKAYNFSAN